MRQNIFRRNKDGVVLLTVICVMTILIIMVMSTLALVAAAQSKAMTNYTDSQSYVTAKSAVDTCVKCLQIPDGAVNVSARDDLRNYLKNNLTGTYPCTADLEVTLPADVIGLGKLSTNASGKQVIKVTRESDTRFVFSATGIDSKSTNTVSTVVEIQTSNGLGIFNRALVSSDVDLNTGGAKILGGVVNVKNATTGAVTDIKMANPTEIYGECHSDGKIIVGQNCKFYLSQLTTMPSAAKVYDTDTVEAVGDISFDCNTEVINDTVSTNHNIPFILTSGKLTLNSYGSGIKIGTGGVTPKRVDVYANDISITNTTKVEIWGDVHIINPCDLKNTIIHGVLYCQNGTPTFSTGGSATGSTVLGAYTNETFKPLVTFPSVSDIMNNTTKTYATPAPITHFASCPNIALGAGTNTNISSDAIITTNLPQSSSLTIHVKNSDIWIKVPDSWTCDTESKVYIDNSGKTGDYNVYLYTANLGQINLNKTSIGLNDGSTMYTNFTSYGNGTHKFGDNKSFDSGAETPGNLYWIINGAGTASPPTDSFKIQNNSCFKGYIYAPDLQYMSNNGTQMTTASTFNAFNGMNNFQSTIVGGLIGATTYAMNNVGPVYVKPGKSIFTNMGPTSTSEQWKQYTYNNN